MDILQPLGSCNGIMSVTLESKVKLIFGIGFSSVLEIIWCIFINQDGFQKPSKVLVWINWYKTWNSIVPTILVHNSLNILGPELS